MEMRDELFMSDRLLAGFQLWQKGKVKFLCETDGLYEFEVTGSKPKKGDRPVYYCTIKEGVGFCNECGDFKSRWNKVTGSLFCKHLFGCIFKIAEIKGVNQQAVIELVNEKEGLKDEFL